MARKSASDRYKVMLYMTKTKNEKETGMALKAQWVVTGELIPGRPVEEYTRVWQYTSDDVEADREVPKEGMTKFTAFVMAANHYAMELQNPSLVNVVNLKFMWI